KPGRSSSTKPRPATTRPTPTIVPSGDVTITVASVGRSSAATHDSANAKPTIIATRLTTVPSPRGDPKAPAGHLGARTLREPYAAHRLPSGDPEPPSGRRSAAARSRSAGRVRPDAADLEPLARLLGPALEPRGKALEAHL